MLVSEESEMPTPSLRLGQNQQRKPRTGGGYGGKEVEEEWGKGGKDRLT